MSCLPGLAVPCLGLVMASGGGWQEVTLGLQARPQSLGQRDLKLGCSSGARHLAPGMQHPQDKAERVDAKVLQSAGMLTGQRT